MNGRHCQVYKEQTHNSVHCNTQTGAALYLMLVLLLLMVTPITMALLYQNKHSVLFAKYKRLKSSKDNLIALAISYPANYGPQGAGPGHLPCPNTDIPDGTTAKESPSPPCVASHYAIGRLPRAVRVDFADKWLSYQDGAYDADSALWYIVSANLVNNPFRPVNTSTRTQLAWNGESQIAAILIDGSSIHDANNSRPSGDADSYIELLSKQHDTISRWRKDLNSNDYVTTISFDALSQTLRKHVAGFVAREVRAFFENTCPSGKGNDCYPYAAPAPDTICEQASLDGWLPLINGNCAAVLFPDLTIQGVERSQHWFNRNLWPAIVKYRVDLACQQEQNTPCQVIASSYSENGITHPMVEVLVN